MKQRKKLPYLPLFKDDWMASGNVRKCSETTRGVYVDLLCIMHDEKRRGSYALHDQELRHTNTRSKTQIALSKATGYQRLPYFAEFLVKRTGSSKTVILKALQELYQREIIVVEGDAIIQPRMYRDNGFLLATDTDETAAAPSAETTDGADAPKADSDDLKNSDKKSAKKTSQKSTKKTRARASRERAHIHNGSESGNNNIDNSISNNSDENQKSPEKTPKAKITAPESPSFDDFWDLYDKKRDRETSEKLWAKLKPADREAIIAYIPLYKEAEPRKKFRKDPTTFLRHRAWEDEIITDTPINNNGYERNKTYQSITASGSRGNQKQDNDDMRNQTVRIVQRIRANRQTNSSVEPDSGDTEG
jgi:hypothetical protein